ncbi:MAG: hypothetical protein LCH85_22245 [Chloroflexi bacterium]|nr:hypothetical protein [Chloroflexota bacterium]
MYTLTLRDALTNTHILDLTDQARDVAISDVECTFALPLDLAVAACLIDDYRLRWVTVNQHGVTRIYQLQRPSLASTGLQCVAVNLIAVLAMDSYSALWSDSNVGNWLETPETIANRAPKLYIADKNNRLFIGLTKNVVYRNGQDAWGWSYFTPITSTRQLLAIQCRYSIDLPTGWVVSFQRVTRAGGYLTTIRNITSAGAVISGALCDSFASTEGLEVVIYNGSGANYTHAGENATKFVTITSMRVVTTTANLINTTVAGAIGTGVQVITPASMQNISFGQQLVINTGASDSEMVSVSATTATTFTATFAKTHLAGATVRSMLVRDSEVVSDALTQAVTLNPSMGLSASNILISTSERDYDDLVFKLAQPIDVLQTLAKPSSFSFGVQEDGVLWFGNPASREWMVQAADVVVCRLLDTVVNSVAVVYHDAANTDQLTTTVTDPISIAQNGFTKRSMLEAATTSQREAELIRDTALSDGKARPVQAQIAIQRLYDRAGTRYPVDVLQRNDMITISNLPPLLASPELRSFTVGEVKYLPATDTVEVVLELPLPQLDVLLAQLAVG